MAIGLQVNSRDFARGVSVSLFTGSKYQEIEQVIRGEVQTFRARETATGRPIFIHKIEHPLATHQATLLQMLLSCLFRSAVVREQVLDYREDSGTSYVVTESLPQCLLLREWLQFESDRCDTETLRAPGEAAGEATDLPSAKYESVSSAEKGSLVEGLGLQSVLMTPVTRHVEAVEAGFSTQCYEPFGSVTFTQKFTPEEKLFSVASVTEAQAAPLRPVLPIVPPQLPEDPAGSEEAEAAPATQPPSADPESTQFS